MKWVGATLVATMIMSSNFTMVTFLCPGLYKDFYRPEATWQWDGPRVILLNIR